MSDQKISHVGDLNELEISCKNIQELDLSKNEFDDWDEVRGNFFKQGIFLKG
jgi:hypothetical protein